MAIHKVREGNGWRLLSDREYEREQNEGCIWTCLWLLIRLVAGFAAGLFAFGKSPNSNVGMVLFLITAIVVFIVVGKIGKKIASWFK